MRALTLTRIRPKGKPPLRPSVDCGLIIHLPTPAFVRICRLWHFSAYMAMRREKRARESETDEKTDEKMDEKTEDGARGKNAGDQKQSTLGVLDSSDYLK